MSTYPERIVCLTEETTETLYLLGEGDRVVGISGYTVRPPEARQKPRISSFLHAKYDGSKRCGRISCWRSRICRPTITSELVKRGLPVFTFNQRSVAEILQMIRVLGGIIGVPAKARSSPVRLERGLETIPRPQRPGHGVRGCTSRSGTIR